MLRLEASLALRWPTCRSMYESGKLCINICAMLHEETFAAGAEAAQVSIA